MLDTLEAAIISGSSSSVIPGGGGTSFCENEGSDLKSMKKGFIWIENQAENLYKMLKSVNNTF